MSTTDANTSGSRIFYINDVDVHTSMIGHLNDTDGNNLNMMPCPAGTTIGMHANGTDHKMTFWIIPIGSSTAHAEAKYWRLMNASGQVSNSASDKVKTYVDPNNTTTRV